MLDPRVDNALRVNIHKVRKEGRKKKNHTEREGEKCKD